MSRRSKVDHYERYVEDAKRALAKLNRSTLEYLVRASEETSQIDGYPAGMQAAEYVNSPNSSDPTLAAVLARAETRDADYIGQALEDIFTRLVELTGHATVIDRKIDVVLRAGDKIKGRVSSLGQCLACHRDVARTPTDPIVSGYCRACRKAWERIGQTDRPTFEREREKFDGHLATACPVCTEALQGAA